MEEEKRKAGRPKGSSSGPRPIIFICFGVNDTDNKSVLDSIVFSTTEDIDNANALNASNRFKDRHGFSPDKIHGPFYECKTKNKSAESKLLDKKDITPVANPSLAGPKKSAEFKGWLGNAYDVTGRTDVMFFMPLEEINPGARKRTPPTASVVEKTELQFKD